MVGLGIIFLFLCNRTKGIIQNYISEGPFSEAFTKNPTKKISC
jgi:hypothetical protein